MPSITPALADHAARSYGVVADTELRPLGIGPTRRRSLVEHGLLIPVFEGVYRLRSAPDTLEARCLATSLAHSRTVVTGRAAGRLEGIRRSGRVGSIEVRTPHFSHALDQPWVRLRRCNVMEEIDVMVRPDRIRVVSPARLAFDLAAELTWLDLESVIEQLVDERRCTLDELYAMDARLYHHRRPGSKAFRAVLGSRPAGPTADSHPEVRLFDALRRGGVQGLTRQHRVELPTGWAIHADIAVPALKWLVPVDHITWHGGRIASERDKQNDRLAQQLGFTVSRVSDHDIDQRLATTTHELLAIHARLVQSRAS